MRIRALGVIAGIGIGLTLTGCGQTQTEQAAYEVTLVPPLAGGTMYHGMAALNDNGMVVGASVTANQAIHAFRYSGGTTVDIGGDGVGESLAMSVNNAGVVVGTHGGQAVMWNPSGRMSKINGSGGFYGSWAYGVNNKGAVVGQASRTDPDSPGARAFCWSNGSFQVLGLPRGCATAHAVAVNTDGTMAGVGLDSLRHLRAVLWSPGRIVDLTKDVITVASEADSINAHGHVVGDLRNASDEQHAFFWDGHVKVLPSIPGCAAMKAVSINNQDVVVGDGTGDEDSSPPFIWDKTHGTRSLGSLIPKSANWYLTKAFAINNRGQILCFGQHGTTKDQICILTPSQS